MKLHRTSLRRNVPVRARPNFSTTTVSEVETTIAQHLDRHKNHQITVVASAPRITPKNPFAIVFYRTLFQSLVTDQIGINEVKLLFVLLEASDTQNIVVKLSQADIARELGVNKSTVSRSFKKLIELNFVLGSDGGSLIVNPQLMTRNSLRKIKESAAYQSAAIRQKYSEYPDDPLMDNF